jgi:tetratricopeptide (TPR) repeat protein
LPASAAIYHQAEQWYRQSLHLCRQMDNRQGESIALNNLGEIAAAQGRYEQAYSYHQESLAVAREIAYTRSITFALDFLGQGSLEQVVAELLSPVLPG